MFKKFSCWVLSLLMVLTMLPVEVMAEEELAEPMQVQTVRDTQEGPAAEGTVSVENEPSRELVPEEEPAADMETERAATTKTTIGGNCGKNVTWTLCDGIDLEIRGTGAMTNYGTDDTAEEYAPWYDYRETIETVRIESGVTSIGNHMFYACSSLTSIVIPNSVESIGEGAFSYCYTLEDVTIGNSVTSIGECAFFQCNSLTSIVIPNSVKSIGVCAFEGCSTLEDITIGSNVTSIGAGAFYGCNSLVSIEIPDCVENIGGGTFANCTALMEINVAEGNTFFKTVDGLLYSADGALLVCCPASKSDSVTIPNNVTNIGESAFEGCSSLSSIVIPDSVECIGERAFCQCTALTDVYYAGTQAQWNAMDIDSEGNESLTNATIHFNGVIASGQCGDDAMWELDNEGTMFISGEGETYSIGDDEHPWDSIRNEIKKVVVAEGITTVCVGMFCDCNFITQVELPGSLLAIDNYAFENCYRLLSVSIPEGTLKIGNYAFSNNYALTEIVIPEGVELIGKYAFTYCGGLKTVTIPSTLETVGVSAFTGCNGLKAVHISDLDAWLGISFYSRTSNPLYYGHKLYLNGFELRELVLPDDITAMGAYVLCGCTSIATVFIPQTLATVGDGALYGLYGVNKIYYEGTWAQWQQINFGNENDWFCSLQPECNTTVEDFAHIDVVDDEHGTVLLEGTYVQAGATVKLTAFPEAGYQLEHFLLNGEVFENDEFNVTENSYTVSATFTKAYDVAASGNCSDSVRWALSEAGTLYLYGLERPSNAIESAMTGYYGEDEPVGYVEPSTVWVSNYDAPEWYAYRESILAVEVSEGIRTLQKNAFCNCIHLESVSLPNSVTRVQYRAFACCAALESIDLPDSVSSMGDYVFSECLSLENVKLPNGLTSVVYGTFDNCISLQDIDLPDSVTSISYNAFSNCRALKNIELPASLTSIVYGAFSQCSSLESITIPAQVSSIESCAFYGCSNLHSADFLGNAPAYLGYSAFYNTAFDFIIFYHANTTGWNSPYWYVYSCACNDPVSDYSTLNEQNRNAQGIEFKLNSLSKTAAVGWSFKGINCCGYYGGQDGVAVIPDTVTKDGTVYTVKSVSQYAFYGNTHLKSVTLGANISSVAPSAFANCPNLSSIEVNEDSTAYKSYDGVLYDKSGLYLYCYPAGHTGTSYEPLATCETIGTMAFYGATNLTELTIPATVTTINGNAFAYMPNLREVTLPFIGCSATDDHPFSYVFDLDQDYIDVSGDWDEKEYWVFSAEIGNIPFWLNTVTILQPNLLESAFEGCLGIDKIYFPDCAELTEIPEKCFAGCGIQTLLFGEDKSSSNTGVLISEGVTTIDASAFMNCLFLEKFVVSEGNTSYAADAYGVLHSKDMTELCCYPAGRQWPYYNVGASVNTIGSYAFVNCGDLVNAYIPQTVTTMEEHAISDCSDTTFCVYKNSAAAIFITTNKQTAWYMDNCEIQQIEMITLPDQISITSMGMDKSELHPIASYGGAELELEDYQIELEKPYGTQTVTLTCGDKSVGFETTIVRPGDLNGDSTMDSTKADSQDMQCLYTYLATGENEGTIEDMAYFMLVANVNGDDDVNILDYQALYEMVKQ